MRTAWSIVNFGPITKAIAILTNVYENRKRKEVVDWMCSDAENTELMMGDIVYLGAKPVMYVRNHTMNWM